MKIRYKISGLIALSVAMTLLSGCGKKVSSKDQNTGSSNITEIQNAGSDTMLNLDLDWAEKYKKI